MKRWESKFLLRTTATTGAVTIEEANYGTEARTQVSADALTKGAAIMAAGTMTAAANPAPAQAQEPDGNGSTNLFSNQIF